MMKNTLIIFYSCFLLFGCGKDPDIVTDMDIAPVSNTGSGDEDAPVRPKTRSEVGEVKDIELEERDYIPSKQNHMEDEQYMTRIYRLLEQEARKVKNRDRFVRVVMAIAWIESRWEHYSIKSGRVRIMMGDNGNSYGMFQIHQKWHGRHPNLFENVEYAINMIRTLYDYTYSQHCRRGTNFGTSEDAFLRRIYAGYNAGSDDICRDGDFRDRRFRNFYVKQPWLDHVNL